jgi:parallel beta-helix repeat protein
VSNTVVGSGVSGIKLGEGDENVFSENEFRDNGKDIVLIDAHDNRLENNQVSGNDMYGIRLKRGSTGNEVIGNTIEDNGKVGVYLWDKSDDNLVKENVVTGHSQYGMRLIDSGSNLIELNEIDGNKRGIGLSYGSVANEITENVLRSNDEYPFYFQGASNNVLSGNEVEDNGRNYYYAKSKSVNTVLDTPELAAKVGDLESQMIIKDDNHGVFVNDRAIPTVVDVGGSTLTLTRNITGGVADFRLADFRAVPTAGLVKIAVHKEGEVAEWTAKAEAGQVEVNYVIGGMNPGSRYGIQRGGSEIIEVEADGQGVVDFNDQLGDGELVEYMIVWRSGPFDIYR